MNNSHMELPEEEEDHSSSDEEQLSLKNDVLPAARLADLTPRMQAAVARAGWSELMPVQAKALPYLFAQQDMMIQSRTGSGKTGAYLLPLLEMINPMDRTTQALVLVPTRELAHQVEAEARILSEETGLSSIAVYGGVGYREQLDAFRSGVHLVIGTPGRILDHLLRRSFSLEHLKFLIFDEADRMLSMGFYPDMRRVQGYLPDHHVSTFMFSATFPPQVIRLANQFLNEPSFLNLSSDHIHVTETEHVYYEVPGMDKDRSLVRILEVENPPSALIFCNTKVRVNYVTTVLKRFGFDADELTSDLSQGNRERVLERVRQGKLRFLVATDVAARGIDLPDLSHVIQYEPPEDPEAYIHRAGRTGRAGASGTAVSLVNITEKAALLRIGKQFGINLQSFPLPTDSDVEKVVAERAITLLEAHLHSRDRLENERMQRFASLAHSLTQDDDENQLLAMLLDEFYQQSFHSIQVSTDQEQNLPQHRGSSSRQGGHRNRRSRDHR
ncbi:MAG: DEAD/DEAH box helicase [Anaerolineaceae bacterium]